MSKYYHFVGGKSTQTRGGWWGGGTGHILWGKPQNLMIGRVKITGFNDW